MEQNDKNLKMREGLKAYQDKILSGEIKKEKTLDPIQKTKKYPKSLKSAIIAKCWDCCCYQKIEVSLCTAKDCPLWIHRPWKNMKKVNQLTTSE